MNTNLLITGGNRRCLIVAVGGMAVPLLPAITAFELPCSAEPAVELTGKYSQRVTGRQMQLQQQPSIY
jgi:hypothetical protein